MTELEEELVTPRKLSKESLDILCIEVEARCQKANVKNNTIYLR